MGSQEPRRLLAQHVAAGIAAEHETSVAIEFPDPVARGIDYILQALLGNPPGTALRGILQRPPNRGSQSFQVALEHVIGGATTQRFNRPLFAQGAGNEYKGNLRRLARGDLESGQTVELRKRKVRKNEVTVALVDRSQEGLLCVDAHRGALDAIHTQTPQGKLRIRLGILHDQHPHVHCLWSSFHEQHRHSKPSPADTP